MALSVVLGMAFVLGGGVLQPVLGQEAEGQAAGPVLRQTTKALVPVDRLPSNFIRVLHAEGDTLWSGPLLYATTDGGATFQAADADSLVRGRNVVFSLDVESTGAPPSVLWAGLAFDAGGGAPGAGGFVYSPDGGATFQYRFPQLDTVDDTTVAYGASTLPAVPITQESQSAPLSLDLDPRTGDVWVAGGLSGIRRSTNVGRSWRRVVLPPDSLQSITPDSTYRFGLVPPQGNDGNLNHFGYSVLVDETGTVWAGTAAGINRSLPADSNAAGDRAWTRTGYTPGPDGLTGSSVTALAEQPVAGARNPIWMATWALNLRPTDRQRFGVTVTRDGGESYEPVLVGERIYDFAFRDLGTQGTRVYAAGDAGLFLSDDGGATWRTVRDFVVAGDAYLPPDLTARSVATTESGLWVGTDEGLLRLARADEPRLGRVPDGEGAATWRLYRADVPVNPESPSEAVPDVATYAYPNPFSPASDRAVRIRYETEEAGAVRIEIFDFNMNRVRTLSDQVPGAGEYETVWDGTDSAGLRIPNGTYFYTVDLGDRAVRGKILVVE